MASQRQTPLSQRIASWAIQSVAPGTIAGFNGSSQAVKRIVVSANATGTLRLDWNGGSFALITVTGSGGFTLEPQGQYDWDQPFTVNCAGVAGAPTLVEFCAL